MAFATSSSAFSGRRRRFPSVSSRFTVLAVFSIAFLLLLFIHLVVEDMSSRTRTVAGHNLEATPWQVFPNNKVLPYSYTMFRCNYLSCPFARGIGGPLPVPDGRLRRSCPTFFGAIHRDLEPWRRSRVSASMVADAGKRAAMRVVILEGRRLFVDLYYACVQSRAMFTVWGLLQLLRRYPGMVPDVDLMFDCMDRPVVNRSEYSSGDGGDIVSPPPPLFRYCTTRDHADIPFPDWSFWGWSEVNIKPWDEEFRSIKMGSKSVKWRDKLQTAFWKGNPNVNSPIREQLLTCNDSTKWGAEIMSQNWLEELSTGFKNSKLSNQCNHRYKIYAEGYAWSVSLKYILACGSVALIIQPQYEDFFSRGLVPNENYWLVNATGVCESIKSAVDWGNAHPSEAEIIGKRGQSLMQDINMERVYDYMYHLLVEYSKLQDFKPTRPPSAQEVCEESLLCIADDTQREYLERSYAKPASTLPCTFPRPTHDHVRARRKMRRKG